MLQEHSIWHAVLRKYFRPCVLATAPGLLLVGSSATDTNDRKVPTAGATTHSQQQCWRSLSRNIVVFAAIALLPGTSTGAQAQQFIPDVIISSTTPANGDLNPYGVAFVPPNFPTGGKIATGDILISNFNDGTNTQGTGTTIVKLTPNGVISPPGQATTFFTSSAPAIGLTTALGVLSGGFVLVGNLPNSNGKLSPGSLQLIDRNGRLVQTIVNNLIDGPWDLTIDDHTNRATVFVSNVLNGTVTRLKLSISSKAVTVDSATVIAKGYTVEPNAAALILGPTGLAHDTATDILYVASTADNAIFAVPNAATRTGPPPGTGTGAIIFQDKKHLRGPLALVFAPNGDLITSNGDAVNGDPTQPSEIVEFTKAGRFVGQFNVDAGQGGAFGVGAASTGFDTVRLAAVDDNANDIIVFTQNAVAGN